MSLGTWALTKETNAKNATKIGFKSFFIMKKQKCKFRGSAVVQYRNRMIWAKVEKLFSSQSKTMFFVFHFKVSFHVFRQNQIFTFLRLSLHISNLLSSSIAESYSLELIFFHCFQISFSGAYKIREGRLANARGTTTATRASRSFISTNFKQLFRNRFERKMRTKTMFYSVYFEYLSTLEALCWKIGSQIVFRRYLLL